MQLGKTNSVRTFIEKACNLLDIKIVWKNKGTKEIGVNKKNNKIIIKVNPKFYRQQRSSFDWRSRKAKRYSLETKHNFQQLIEIMLKSDLENIKKIE